MPKLTALSSEQNRHVQPSRWRSQHCQQPPRRCCIKHRHTVKLDSTWVPSALPAGQWHCPGSRAVVLGKFLLTLQLQAPAMLCSVSRNAHCVGQVTDKLLWPHIALGVALHIWDDLDGCRVFRQKHHVGHVGPMHPDDGGQVVERLHGQPQGCIQRSAACFLQHVPAAPFHCAVHDARPFCEFGCMSAAGLKSAADRILSETTGRPQSWLRHGCMSSSQHGDGPRHHLAEHTQACLSLGYTLVVAEWQSVAGKGLCPRRSRCLRPEMSLLGSLAGAGA